MKNTNKPQVVKPAPSSRRSRKAKPLKLTIGGELAERIRKFSRTVGVRPSSLAAQFAHTGELSTGHHPEALEYQLETAARFVGLSPRATSELHAHALRAEAEYIAALRTPAGTKGGAEQ